MPNLEIDPWIKEDAKLTTDVEVDGIEVPFTRYCMPPEEPLGSPDYIACNGCGWYVKDSWTNHDEYPEKIKFHWKHCPHLDNET